jgi:hypothetical protein
MVSLQFLFLLFLPAQSESQLRSILHDVSHRDPGSTSNGIYVYSTSLECGGLGETMKIDGFHIE